MQLEEQELRRKNHDLVEAYREKARQHISASEKYEKLKKAMSLNQTRDAASEMVDETLLAAISGHGERPVKSRSRNPDLSQGHRFPAMHHRRREHATSTSTGSNDSGGRPQQMGMGPPQQESRARPPPMYPGHTFANRLSERWQAPTFRRCANTRGRYGTTLNAFRSSTTSSGR